MCVVKKKVRAQAYSVRKCEGSSSNIVREFMLFELTHSYLTHHHSMCTKPSGIGRCCPQY